MAIIPEELQQSDNYFPEDLQNNPDLSNTPAKATDNDVANNDGSTLETLDTALHDKPGYSEGETVSGSNRADYYEKRSYGKTDVEEELDEINKRNSSNK